MTTTLKKTQPIDDRITTYSSQPVSEEKDSLQVPEFDLRKQFRRQNLVELEGKEFNSAQKGLEMTYSPRDNELSNIMRKGEKLMQEFSLQGDKKVGDQNEGGNKVEDCTESSKINAAMKRVESALSEAQKVM